MVSSGSLTKSTSWHCHDTCLFEHFHAVDKVGVQVLFFGMIKELIAKVNSRESVHGTFNFLTSNIFHIVEGSFQKFSTLDKTLFDMTLL
jgi:hypothetical protein